MRLLLWFPKKAYNLGMIRSYSPDLWNKGSNLGIQVERAKSMYCITKVFSFKTFLNSSLVIAI